MEMKITDDQYPKFTSGYKVIASKATSHNREGLPSFGRRVTVLLRWRQFT
jgi:hypothetical protein